MLKSSFCTLISAFLVFLLSQPASAYNLNFLRNSPVRHFTEEDRELMNAAVREALNDTPDGQTVSWKNPQSNSFGTTQPLTTRTQAGVTCRDLKIENSAKGLTGGSVHRFCRKPDGTWALQQDAVTTTGRTRETTEQPE